jgi:uncharacterized protein YndB with AHSA1/START domain
MATIDTTQDAIVGEVEIAAPPDRVFQALTDPKQLLQWWTSGECPVKLWKFDARPGGKWTFQTEDSHGKLTINSVSQFQAEGEILEYDPPRRLAYTWIANWHADRAVRTVVRWELTPAGKGTRVKVTHSGLASEPVARKDYSGGWPGVLEQLKKHVEV